MEGQIRTCALLGRFTEQTVHETAAALLTQLAARCLTTLIQNDAEGADFGQSRCFRLRLAP